MSADLVTGATGFIGRHLAQRLVQDGVKNGRKVRVFCRRGSAEKLPGELLEQVDVAFGDLRDRDSIDAAVSGVSRIFHCAGHVSDWGSVDRFHAANVQGTEWFLEAAARERVSRFVHLSSIAVFGVPAPAYFDDQSEYGPGADLYSRTKIASERLVFRYARERGLPVAVLRPPVVYGKDGTWLEEPLRMIEKGKMFLLGGGKGTCHPCYVGNLVDAMLLVADHPAAVGRAYIVGDDQPISFREYFNHVARLADAGPIERSIPLPVARTTATVMEAISRLRRTESRPMLTHTAIHMVATPSRMSMRKIREELQFQPRYTVESAMAEIRGQRGSPV